MGVAGVALVGLGFQILGLIIHISGVATPWWSVGGHSSFGTIHDVGLWQQCRCLCTHYNSAMKETFEGTFEASEALATIGILAAIAAIVTVGLFIFLPLFGRPITAPIHIVSGGAAIFACLSIIVGVIIWAAGVHDKFEGYSLSYSFALSIAGAALLLFGGCLAIAGGRPKDVQGEDNLCMSDFRQSTEEIEES